MITNLGRVVAALLVATALVAEAQPAGKIPRVGVLSTESPDVPFTYALRDGLRELGYAEGQNLAVEWQWARGDSRRLPDLAAELVRLQVDVIVASNNAAIAAAQRATNNIPIVMVFPGDPVGQGFVASLARPAGNITGLSAQTGDLIAKRLQLLQETVPNASRGAVLWDPTFAGIQQQVRAAQTAAPALGVRLQLLEAGSPASSRAPSRQ